MIILDEKYAIRYEPMNWVLLKKELPEYTEGQIKSMKARGYEIKRFPVEVVKGYYPSLNTALQSYITNRVQDEAASGPDITLHSVIGLIETIREHLTRRLPSSVVTKTESLERTGKNPSEEKTRSEASK